MEEFNIGVLFGKLLISGLGWLGIKGVGEAIALVILLSGTSFLIAIIIKYRNFCNFLNNAIEKLDGIDTEEKFNDNYDALDEYFISTGNDVKNGEGLSVCWKEFTETIIRPGKDSDRQIIFNTARPDNYFYASAAKFTTPILGILPNIFVGIGLLFTFAGLIVALSEAVSGLDTDTKNMQEAILTLLRVTSAKFYTSLMALGFSILLTITLRYCTSRRDKLFKDLTDKLERGMKYVSVAEFSVKQLNEMKQQTQQLNEFGTTIAVAVGESIGKAMKPVVDGIGNLGANTAGAVEETIGKINEEAGNSFSAISGRLDTLAETLGGLSEQLSGTSQQFEKQLLKTLENLDQSSAKIANNLTEAASSASQEMNQATQGMTNSVGKISEAAEGISHALTNASSDASNQAKEAIIAAGEGIASKFGDAGESMRSALDEHLSDLTNAMKGFEGSLTDAKDNFSQLKKDLGSVSTQIAKSTQDMSAASSSFGEIAEPIAEASKAVEASVSKIDQVTTTMQQATATMQQAIQDLEGKMQKNSELWERHSRHFEGVDENLGKIFIGVNDSIKESQAIMSAFVSEMDKAFTNALASQTSAIEEFGEVVEDLVKNKKNQANSNKG